MQCECCDYSNPGQSSQWHDLFWASTHTPAHIDTPRWYAPAYPDFQESRTDGSRALSHRHDKPFDSLVMGRTSN